MAGFDYKQSYAWNEAIELAQSVFTLIESLPETAATLAQQLATSAVEVPAKVAKNLVKQEEAKLGPALALATEVELVGRIYPALDISDVDKKLTALMDRLQAPSFTELKPAAPVKAEVEEAESDEEADEPDNEEPESVDEEVEEEEEAEPEVEATHINVQEG